MIYYTKTAQSHYQIIILKLSNAFFQAVFPATASFLTPSLVLPVRIEALRRSLDSLLTERSTRSDMERFYWSTEILWRSWAQEALQQRQRCQTRGLDHFFDLYLIYGYHYSLPYRRYCRFVSQVKNLVICLFLVNI